MKKILVFSLILVFLSASASAQSDAGSRLRKPGIQRGSGQLSRPERFELRKDVYRTQVLQRRARRDGIVTPIERRRIHRSKCDTRRDAYRFRHNGRRRVI